MSPRPRTDITAKIIASSIDPLTGARIDTLQLRYPRIIHSEFMTHRVFSRNASSSRAIPTLAIMERDADIYVPQFRHNKAGMQPGEYLSPEEQIEAERIWRDMATYVAAGCQQLAERTGLNIHKQWANRPLEWFGYIDVLASSTDFANFSALRIHDAAQDEIYLLAQEIKKAREAVEPRVLQPGEWHLPYITDEDRYQARYVWPEFRADLLEIFGPTPTKFKLAGFPDRDLLLVASAARCCRLSYSKLDGTPTTFAEDVERFRKLVPAVGPVHASPMEHQATPLAGYDPHFQGNFRGFAQFRKFFPNEAVS